MTTPEERRVEQRRRRTKRQREMREQERICGNCHKAADGGLIEWAGRGRPLRIPICRDCRAMLAGIWRDMGEVGVRCPLNQQRPCTDCMPGTPAGRPKGGFLSRLLSG